ncbi:hypothetical protein NQ176_g1178 [Zarea fungicola]|uniref:Uncharacterized protein n=1 Tax=Zarea fungicola TaxID=93591 RepID=A0ACC1NW12_9HYPO|nr:hypothetical protein NQ176_g1178 [Lecanicillium fungicola]
MMLRQPWAILAILGLHAICAVADSSCVPGCATDVSGNFQQLGCASAADKKCICVKQDFVKGVFECAAKCSASPEDVRNALIGVSDFCFDFAAQVPAVVPGAAPSSTTSTGTSTTGTSTTSTSTTSTSSTSTTSTSTTASTSSPPPSSTSSTSTSTSTTSSSTTAASSSSAGTSPSSTSPTAGETSPVSSPAPASGISSGAAAGIGIGVAVVVIAVGAIAFCLLKKRKAQAGPRQSLDISKPLPGSGRTYPARDHRDRDSFDKYGNDIEMTSNRYEDMVPSQQPRTMV